LGLTGDSERAALVDVGPDCVDGVGERPRALQVGGVRLEFLVGDSSKAGDELVHNGEDGYVGALGDGIGKGADEVVGDGLKDLGLKRVRSFDSLRVFHA
jgi:hypothetical protein